MMLMSRLQRLPVKNVDYQLERVVVLKQLVLEMRLYIYMKIPSL